MKNSDQTTSLVIVNYNYAPYLKDAIDSALQQTCSFYEIIVVDDGSTDNSVEIIKSYAGRIETIFKKNGGQASAMNKGFEAARGNWVWFLDADDYLFPDSLNNVQSRYGSGCGMIYGQLLRVTADRKPLGPCISRHQPFPEGDLFPYLARYGTVYLSPNSGLIFRRDLLANHMPIPEEEFRGCADDYIRLALGVSTPVAAIEKPIAAFRAHSQSDQARTDGNIDHIQRYVTASAIAYQKLIDQAMKRGWPVTPDRSENNSRLALFQLILFSHQKTSLLHRTKLALRALRTACKDPGIKTPKKFHRTLHVLGIWLSPPVLVPRVNILFISCVRLLKKYVIRASHA